MPKVIYLFSGDEIVQVPSLLTVDDSDSIGPFVPPGLIENAICAPFAWDQADFVATTQPSIGVDEDYFNSGIKPTRIVANRNYLYPEEEFIQIVTAIVEDEYWMNTFVRKSSPMQLNNKAIIESAEIFQYVPPPPPTGGRFKASRRAIVHLR